MGAGPSPAANAAAAAAVWISRRCCRREGGSAGCGAGPGLPGIQGTTTSLSSVSSACSPGGPGVCKALDRCQERLGDWRGGDSEDEDLGRSSLSPVIQIPRALLQRFSGWNPPVQRAGHLKGHDHVPCSPATHGPLLPSQGTVWKQGRRAE